jgi:hypothetical protein
MSRGYFFSLIRLLLTALSAVQNFAARPCPCGVASLIRPFNLTPCSGLALVHVESPGTRGDKYAASYYPPRRKPLWSAAARRRFSYWNTAARLHKVNRTGRLTGRVIPATCTIAVCSCVCYGYSRHRGKRKKLCAFAPLCLPDVCSSSK